MIGEIRWRFLPGTSIGGLNVTTASRNDLVNAMVSDVRLNIENPFDRPRLVFDVNGHALSLKETDKKYKEDLNKADLIHADGGFIVTLSKWISGKKIFERSATTDLYHDFSSACRDNGIRVFLLGGDDKTNKDCASITENLYPGIKIVGQHHGYFDQSSCDNIIEIINSSKPDIIWVGLGKPLEQKFCVENANRIKAAWLITCGGCYNYVTGNYKRAPKWMQKVNLEWLHRAITGPRYLIWRYIISNPHAVWISLKFSFKKNKAK